MFIREIKLRRIVENVAWSNMNERKWVRVWCKETCFIRCGLFYAYSGIFLTGTRILWQPTFEILTFFTYVGTIILLRFSYLTAVYFCVLVIFTVKSLLSEIWITDSIFHASCHHSNMISVNSPIIMLCQYFKIISRRISVQTM